MCAARPSTAPGLAGGVGIRPSDTMVPDPGPVTLPAGKLFVMGDNRHDSNDSRYMGLVDVKNVRGKVTYIYWSKDSQRNWTRVR